MKRDNDPEFVTPERTTFELTDNEVITALVAFVEGKGEEVPTGKRFVLVRSDHSSSRPLAMLVVDHPKSKRVEAGVSIVTYGDCGDLEETR